MAKDAPTVNGSQKHENTNVEKPAVIAKEPTVVKPMAYEPDSVKRSNGVHNGATNHTSHSMTQRKTTQSFPSVILVAD